MDLKTRIEMVGLYYKNGCSATAALRCYKTEHKLLHYPFTAMAVTKLIKKFKKHGVVTDLPKSGRPSVSSEVIDTVKEENRAGKENSATGCYYSTQISNATGVPHSTVKKILHQKLNMRPYRLKNVHHLEEHDYAF